MSVRLKTAIGQPPVIIAGQSNPNEIFAPATEETDGKSGLVPTPYKGKANRFLASTGDWDEIGNITVTDVMKLFGN